MGRCMVYTGIRLLLLIRPFISSLFFLSNFQTKYSDTLFSGTVRPRRLKLGTHMDNGQMYCVYQNQTASKYSSLYFFFFSLSPIFKHWKFSSHFSQELWGLEGWNLVHTWTVDRCIVYWNQAAALIRPFIFHFSFSPIFKHVNFSSHVSQELLGLEGWNLLHMWKMGGCIVYTGLMLLLLFVPLFFIFLSLQFSNIKNFRHNFLRNCEA